MTSVVSTARTPTSSQIAMSSGVHAGRVRGRELGDVPDAHHLRHRGPAAVRLGVALERRHEAEADRLDDGVDEVRHPPALEALEAALQLGELVAGIGNHDEPLVAPGVALGDRDVAWR